MEDQPVPELAEQVERLVAVHEVELVVQRYVRALDTHDADLLRSVFAEDAVLEGYPPGETRTGVDAIVETYEELWDGAPIFNHLVVNQAVDVDGETATASSYAVVVSEADDGRLSLFGGYYDRTIERREGDWVHTRLRIGTQYSGFTLSGGSFAEPPADNAFYPPVP